MGNVFNKINNDELKVNGSYSMYINKRRKKTVLFDISGEDDWIGGVYYLRNILYLISVNDSILNKCKPIIVCSTKFYELFSTYKEIATLYIYKDGNKYERLKCICKALIQADYIYYYHQYRFDPLNVLSKKAIYWIPDFQELYYPRFFTDKQIAIRDTRSREIENTSSPLVLSSYSCRDDYLSICKKKNPNQIFIVHFVSAIDKEVQALNEEFINRVIVKYGLNEKKYYMISNQFWQHKNHMVIFNAIIDMKKESIECPMFVFTGGTNDYRNVEYFETISKMMNSNEIKGNARFLGFINRSEQLALMIKAHAIIQPSLFEGWGTVVEDAKVLDKTILLSDIPIHHEQANSKCIFFDPNNHRSLIDILLLENSKNHKENIEQGIKEMYKDAYNYSEEIMRLIEYLETKHLCDL